MTKAKSTTMAMIPSTFTQRGMRVSDPRLGSATYISPAIGVT